MRTGQPLRETVTSSTDRLEVREASSGLGVRFATERPLATVTRLDGLEQPEDPLVTELYNTLGGIDVDVLISSEGAWNDVVDAAGLQSRLEHSFDVYFSGVLSRIEEPDARAAVEARLTPYRALMNPEVVVAVMARDWAWETAFWSGATVEVGAPYTVTMTGRDVVAGEPIENTATFVVTAVGPCRKGRGSPQCADIEVHIVTDPVAQAAAATRSIARTMPPDALAAAGGVERLSATFEQRNVGRVEVATLRPWAWTQHVTTHMEVKFAAEAQSHVRDRTLHSEKTWTWAPAAH